MFDVSKRKKNVEKGHMKKNERKEKWKERKIQSKECAWCEKNNRSIGESEGKIGQKDDICPYFFEYTLLVL